MSPFAVCGFNRAVSRDLASDPRLDTKSRSTAAEGRIPNHVAIGETVIRIDDEKSWQYTGADPDTYDLLHLRLFTATSTVLTEKSLHELRQKHDVEPAVFLVDGAQHLQTHWPGPGSDKPNGPEIGTASNGFSEDSNAELPRSQTVSATLSPKPPKIGSKRLLPRSMLLTKTLPSRRQ